MFQIWKREYSRIHCGDLFGLDEKERCGQNGDSSE